MRYAVVIEKDAKGFGAYVPDLPGCVAAAKTRDEVVKLIHGAIEFHIEGLKEDGLYPSRRLASSSLKSRPSTRRRVDAKLVGLPSTAAERLRLMCRDLVSQ